MIAGAAAGACAGFLWWSTSPAKIIMGDTGSMALGGLIAGQAVATRTVLLLPIIALLYVIITLSRIIQYTSFKTTGKRVFLMSPLHHHFEQAGWSRGEHRGAFLDHRRDWRRGRFRPFLRRFPRARRVRRWRSTQRPFGHGSMLVRRRFSDRSRSVVRPFERAGSRGANP